MENPVLTRLRGHRALMLNNIARLEGEVSGLNIAIYAMEDEGSSSPRQVSDRPDPHYKPDKVDDHTRRLEKIHVPGFDDFKVAEEENDEPAPAGKRYKMSDRQASLLVKLIGLQNAKKPTTRNQLGEEMGCTTANVNFILQPLIDNGYVSEHKDGRQFYYIALRTTDGTLIGQADRPKTEDGKPPVTIVPPGYARGYVPQEE